MCCARAVQAFIVEDSPVILENLVETLQEVAGVQVIGSAPDEASAVKWLAEHPTQADLLIIDIFLKTGSGLAVLRTAQRAGVRSRRVVLTNYATPDMRTQCLALGAERVFDKSTELEDLLGFCQQFRDGTV